MNGAFAIGAIGLDAQQRALDMIANNISNVNTPAFKRSAVRFSEILANGTDPDVVRADLGESQITTAGVRSQAIFMLNEQGRLQSTGRPMDLAISGQGFIELMGPSGQTLLWRGGTLRVNDDGQLASDAGLPFKSGIVIPTDATALTIGSDGIVRAQSGADAPSIEIGQIMLVRVDDPASVERLDGGLYREAQGAQLLEGQPGEDGLGLLAQGSIESSAVELTSEMVQLLLVQRAYAANAQIVQAADQIMALANGLRR